jgi:hypothetical protein
MKFISDNYFSMHQTLQPFTSIITSNISIFISIEVIKNTCTHIYANTKVIENANFITAWVGLKLFIVLGLMK